MTALEPIRIAAAVTLGGALCVERKAFGQFMLSRPLVAATAVGMVLCGWHGWLESMGVGIVLELFFLTTAPYGTSTPPHETLAALFAGALTAQLPYYWPPEVAVPVALALAVPVAALGQFAEAKSEWLNSLLAERMNAELAAGRIDAAMKLPLKAMVTPFLGGAVAVLAGALLNRRVIAFIHPARTVLAERIFGAALPLCLAVLAGLLLRTGRTPRSFVVSVAGVMLMFVALLIASWHSASTLDAPFFMR